MSHDSYVCGFLKLRSALPEALAEIARLPATSEEDTWPYLTSAMFSYTSAPQYRDMVIHFAASYKDICGSWLEWEGKFERLLGALDVDEVKVLIEDCYQGDFIVFWSQERSGMRKIRRALKYEDGPEVTILS